MNIPEGAAALGIQTALVMTGVETAETLARSAIQPDLVFPGLPELTAETLATELTQTHS